jgi:hypothetical protein
MNTSDKISKQLSGGPKGKPRFVRCTFTVSEAGHILSLIECNERNGEYTAPKDQYWKRSERIKSKLASMPND